MLVQMLKRRLPMLLVEARAVSEDERERVLVSGAVLGAPIPLSCDLYTIKYGNQSHFWAAGRLFLRGLRAEGI